MKVGYVIKRVENFSGDFSLTFLASDPRAEVGPERKRYKAIGPTLSIAGGRRHWLLYKSSVCCIVSAVRIQ